MLTVNRAAFSILPSPANLVTLSLDLNEKEILAKAAGTSVQPFHRFECTGGTFLHVLRLDRVRANTCVNMCMSLSWD